MSSAPSAPKGLHFVANSPVHGLAVLERRISQPEATLICVHGGLDRGGSFARLARRIDAFDVVAYDRRGYQGSRSLAPLSLEHHVSDLLTLARRERERGAVILFGHSFGGVITFSAALADPSMATMVINYEAPLPWILARESSRPAPSDDPQEEAERFFRRMVSNSAWERLSEAERDSRRMDGPALLNDLATLHRLAPFDLSRLEIPGVYLHGDWMLAPYYRALSEMLADLNPQISSHELSNAGHGAHLSSPDKLAQVIHDCWSRGCG